MALNVNSVINVSMYSGFEADACPLVPTTGGVQDVLSNGFRAYMISQMISLIAKKILVSCLNMLMLCTIKIDEF